MNARNSSAWSPRSTGFSGTSPTSNDPICNQPFAIQGSCIPVNLARAVDYNDNGNHKHNIVTNFTYTIPSSHFDSALLKQALNGWILEGTFEYASGAPGFVTESTSTDNLTGSGGWGTRVNLVPSQSPYSKTGNNGFNYLNINAFSPSLGGPGVCTGSYTTCGWGNSGAYNYIGFPTDNLDVSLFKDFQLGANESRKFEIRWETYNTLNHTEFTSLASTATAGSGVAFFLAAFRLGSVSAKLFFTSGKRTRSCGLLGPARQASTVPSSSSRVSEYVAGAVLFV